jgi:hypothetical protein
VSTTRESAATNARLGLAGATAVPVVTRSYLKNLNTTSSLRLLLVLGSGFHWQVVCASGAGGLFQVPGIPAPRADDASATRRAREVIQISLRRGEVEFIEVYLGADLLNAPRVGQTYTFWATPHGIFGRGACVGHRAFWAWGKIVHEIRGLFGFDVVNRM